MSHVSCTRLNTFNAVIGVAANLAKNSEEVESFGNVPSIMLLLNDYLSTDIIFVLRTKWTSSQFCVTSKIKKLLMIKHLP